MSKKILVFGNTVFTKEIIKAIKESGKYEVLGWTGGDVKSNEVKKYCWENGIKLFEIKKPFHLKTDGFRLLKDIKPDLVIVIAYGKIIPESFLNIPEYGFINIHGSILPDLRGATPIQAALLKGYSETGVTIQRMVYKMDEGDILKTYKVNVDENDNFETLRDKMIGIATNDLNIFLDNYFQGNINSVAQDNNKATYCYIDDYSRENAQIDWNNNSLNIHNKIRAFYPEPTTWSIYKGKHINFIASLKTDIVSNEIPGTIFSVNKKLYVSTNDNDLEITKLVIEGKKPMSGTDFANGILRNENFILK